MNKPLYRVIVVTGLLLITSLPGLLFLAYQVQQRYIRHEMEEKLEKNSLHFLRLPAASLVWYKKDKEIIVDGKLFDIKSMRIEGDMAMISGLFDEEETLIKKKIEDLSEQKQKDDEKSFYSKLIGLQYFKEDNIELELSLEETELKHNPYWIFNFKTQFQDHHSPPPELS